MTVKISRKPAAAITKLRKDPSKLFKFLQQQGTFKFLYNKILLADSLRSRVTVLRAASTDMWPMGTHFWVRDNALIGHRLVNIELPDTKFELELRRKGEALLWSSLTIMSTPSQLNRFIGIIENHSTEFINASANWPQIFLAIDSNLLGIQHEGWSHKQDAWQILAHSMLTHLESGRLSSDQLTVAHKDFFALLTPFLAKVRFYQQENSGSWEELEAIRTSVVAWDTALLHQIYRMSGMQKFAFLRGGFEHYKSTLTNYGDTSTFQNFLMSLMIEGARYLKNAIPLECPSYSPDNPRFRKADAALIYLLQLDTPRLVAQLLDLPDSWIAEREKMLLSTIETLYDPRCGGYRRYLNDSYQRLGYFRPEVAKKLSELYGAPSGDASSGFTGRDQAVPKGPEAGWSHFTWQLAAWSGRRYQQTKNIKYLSLHQRYFERALATITHRGEKSVEYTAKGKLRQKSILPYRITECYLTEEDENGKHYLFPSPHTPLNWATAEALDAFSVILKK